MTHTTVDEVRASPNRTLFILALGALAYTLAQTMIVPALPQIQRDLHVSAASVTWLLTAFLLASSIATPIVGRLGDMYGKERLLLLALLCFGAGNLIAAFGHSLGVYIAGRAVQGVGGAILPLAIGIIRDEFPREKVATGIGTISAMFGIGGGVGLVISGVMVDQFGVDSIFWLGVVTSAMAALATWRYVPESPVRVKARIDYPGAALLTATLLALLIGVSEGNSWGWTSPRILGLFAAAIVLGAIWTWFELRTTDPLIDLRLMRRRPMWTVNLAGFAIGFAMFGSYILIPQLVQTPTSSGYGFGASVTLSGIYLLPSALLMLFSGPLSGRISTRRGSRLPLMLGTAASGIAYFSLAALHAQPWEIFLGSALLGLGIGLAFAAMANLVVDAVPQEMTGVASGVNTIVRSIGGAVGGQVAAAILTASASSSGLAGESGYTGAFLMSGFGAIVALGASALVPRSAPRSVETTLSAPGAAGLRRGRGGRGRVRRRRAAPARRGEVLSAENRLTPEVKAIAIVVVIGAIMSILDTTIVNVALETLSKDLHSPLATIQWVSTGYLLALATVIPLTGWAAERFGAKRVWMSAVAGFVFTSVLCGLAWSADALIAFRVLQGLAGGMIMPVGMITLAQAAGPRHMGRVMSIVGVPMLLAPVLGPVLGGLLIENLSWRWIFFVNLPVGIVGSRARGAAAAGRARGGQERRAAGPRGARPPLPRHRRDRLRTERGRIERLARQPARVGADPRRIGARRRVRAPLVVPRLPDRRRATAAQHGLQRVGGDRDARRRGAVRRDAAAAAVLPDRSRPLPAAGRPAARAAGHRRGDRDALVGAADRPHRRRPRRRRRPRDADRRDAAVHAGDRARPPTRCWPRRSSCAAWDWASR